MQEKCGVNIFVKHGKLQLGDVMVAQVSISNGT